MELVLVNLLKRDYDSSNLEIEQLLNERIVIGDYELSVQCSKNHYCMPKDNVFLTDYKSFEVLVSDNIPKELLKDLESHQYHVYMNDTYEIEGLYVFVPTKLIEKLITSLYKEIGL